MTNPLLHPSDLPFGLPDFASATPPVVAEALRRGIAVEEEQWAQIAGQQAPADVTNTVVAIDAAGSTLSRVSAVFFVLLSSVGGTEWEELYEEFAPKLAAHEDEFWMSTALYSRLLAVSELSSLDAETRHYVGELLSGFRRRGVLLEESEKEHLRALNAKISSLEAQIETRISRQLERTGTAGDDVGQLRGLTDAQIEAAVAAASGTTDAWRLKVMNFSQPPLIGSLADHDTRGRVFADSIRRGFGDDPDLDTREPIVELAQLRAERSELLGFPDHASLVMDDQTVPGPAEAIDLLATVGAAALRRVEDERGDYTQQAIEAGFTLGPEDWVYFEDRARGAQLGIDPGELREYFELDRVVEDGVFYAASRLFGLSFRPRPDLSGWTDEVRAWEVFEEDGRPLGLFLADYYTRPGKNGGAWMSEIQAGSGRAGCLPIVTNNANFPKPDHGSPTLLDWDGVETCFHEFGHALHGLLTNTYYSGTAGTEVPSDFVELPSQLNEMWAFHPEVIANFARHYRTGEPLADEVVRRLSQSKHFGQGFATLEYVQAALIDQYWHRGAEHLPSAASEVESFESASLADSSTAHDLVVPRYRTPYFAHTFAGGYDGAYYSYMWAEAMVGELEDWFAEQSQVDEDGHGDGGLNREAGTVLRRELLARGSSRDPLESFVAVRGHAPRGEAVIRRRGLS